MLAPLAKLLTGGDGTQTPDESGRLLRVLAGGNVKSEAVAR
jgi:hypothetical protein